MTTREFRSLEDFYPHYLREHSDPNCRRLHFLGTTLGLVVFLYALATQTWWALLLVPILGYGFAWIGHFFFEGNKPATFQHPFYSFLSDWLMYRDMLTGRLRF